MEQMMMAVIGREEAREARLPRFFTGQPCDNGHVAQRYVSSGGCCECARISNRSYVKSRTATDPEFAAHRSALSLQWAKEHPDKVKATQTKREQLPRRKEMKSASTKAWRKRNPDKIREHNKRWREKNPDWHHSDTRNKWLADNLELVREMQRKSASKLRAKYPARFRAYEHNYEAQKRENGGSFTENDIALIYEEQGGKCAGCSKSKKLEIDHIIAVAKGGSNDPSNLQLLCRRCNASKSDKDMADWLHGLWITASYETVASALIS